MRPGASVPVGLGRTKDQNKRTLVDTLAWPRSHCAVTGNRVRPANTVASCPPQTFTTWLKIPKITRCTVDIAVNLGVKNICLLGSPASIL